MALGVCAAAAPAARRRGAASTLILRSADVNENTLVRGELVSTLRGNVVFLYDELTVRSDNARWWRDQGTVQLTGNVRAERGSKVLTCDRMTFLKKRQQLEGSGRVVYRSPSDGVRVSGRHGTYDVEREFFTLTGEPRFERSAGEESDTLVIVGREMSYDDSTRVATAKHSVKITRGPLVALCERAWYETRVERAHLRGSPHITYEDNVMDGDSVDLYFAGDTLRGVSVDGRAHGLYLEIDSVDTNTTDVTSDSMYLSMNTAGGLDSVWAWGDVLTTYYLSAESDSANRVSGKAMVLTFERRGTLREALVWGNARSTYFVREDDSWGRNEASGDTIHVYFRDGKASELVLSGQVRGTYAPEDAR